MKKNSNIVIFITCSSRNEAAKISKELLRHKLVACTNIVKGIFSSYWWKGKIEKSKEVLIIAKGNLSNFRKVVKLTKNIHSYTVPEIIALPIIAGNPDYLAWIKGSIK